VEPFYAVKCNPDPVIIKTLAILGCNFDCASRAEIALVEEASRDLPRKPDVIYANPCKARAHLIEAVCKGIRKVTFDNATEVEKCASISKNIQLILRIATDDRGSRCRFSTKFGAPRYKWKPLLAAAKKHGLAVIGVSFHVGSGCRDASKYELALKDAKEIFEMAEKEFGMKMSIVDIGGGFPGETHSLWNPADEIDDEEEKEVEKIEGVKADKEKEEEDDHFMFFTEIAAEVGPALDKYFPASSGVRLIGEPGRYFAAATATLCCAVSSARSSAYDTSFEETAVNDKEAAAAIDEMTREEQSGIVRRRLGSIGQSMNVDDSVFASIQDELEDYSKLYASQQLAQQEFDVYNDKLDLYEEGVETASNILGPPDEHQLDQQLHTVEGMAYPLVAATADLENEPADAMITLAAAGEAAVKGLVVQTVIDNDQLQDDFAYYINDGVYGAFNNIMFDHANIRPRVLRMNPDLEEKKWSVGETSDDGKRELYASTVFGPTCDSIDVIARSVLLPKLNVGDWMYFQNMGAYTMAAASSFNGFSPSEKFYVCSVRPSYFEEMIKGIATDDEEKKQDFSD